MKPPVFFLCAGLLISISNPLRGVTAPDSSPAPAEAEEIVGQMRGISMQWGIPRSDGRIDPAQQRREAIIAQLGLIGKKAVPAVAHALEDHDMQMRRNAALVLNDLAGAYSGPPKVDIRAAMPALIKATGDFDSDVRAWAAQALGEIGPDAKEAVPALIKLLSDSSEGSRNSACIALAKIGPAAKAALPALQKALNDPSKDVRQFAKGAIGKIENK